MFCERCKLPHGNLNKLEGIRHLQAMKRQGRIRTLGIDRFVVCQENRDVEKIVMNTKRKNPLLVRTTALEGDVQEYRWEEQPRKKFPPLNLLSEDATNTNLQRFFSQKDDYMREFCGEGAPRLIYQTVVLPVDEYVLALEVRMEHTLKTYYVLASHPENGIDTMQIAPSPYSFLEKGKLVWEGNAARLSMEDVDERLHNLIDHAEWNFGRNVIAQLEYAIAGLIEEFNHGTSRLRAVVYKNGFLPVAFDWLRKVD